jgi:hypothetical protein
MEIVAHKPISGTNTVQPAASRPVQATSTGNPSTAQQFQSPHVARFADSGLFGQSRRREATVISPVGAIQRQKAPNKNSVVQEPRSMKDVAALVAELKELITLLAAPFLKLEAGYKSEKLAQLQLVPDAGQHVHEALAFAFLLHNPEAAIKSMNKDAVGIDVSKLPSWQAPDSGGQLFSVNVDYSKLTARQLADIKAKRKMGTVLVTLTNAPSWKEEGAFREQLGGTYGNDELGVVFINLDAEKTAEYKKEAAFTRAMALAKNPAYKAMFPTGPNTLWFVRQNIRLHPEDYRDFLWRSGHVPLSELTEILDSGYEQAAHATGEWIKSWDREAPREAPLLIQLIADLNPIMGIAKFISLVKDDKPLYAMPGTKTTTIDWVEGWVGLAAAGEAIFGDLIAVSFKSAKALKVVKVGKWAANFTGKLSEELVQKWAKECIKDERVKKLIADIITVGLDKGIWDGCIRNVDKAIDKSKGAKTGVKPIVQRKLEVNTPGDAHEQEADRTAEQVLRMPEPQPQGACAPFGHPGYQNAQANHEDLQTKHVESDHTREVATPPIVHEVIHSSGQPLDSTTREFMEPRFGRDFSNVRVHTDAQAAKSAREVNALAYTVGRDIAFGEGAFETRSTRGKQLIAHELTHVVQQGFAQLNAGLDTPLNQTSFSERDANHVAELPDVGSAGISSNIATSIQRFSGFEHVELGDSATGGPKSLIVLDCHDKDFPERRTSAKWPKKWSALLAGASRKQIRAVTQGLTYGEIVALSGDFYDGFDALNKAPLVEIFDLIPLIHSPKATTMGFEIATGGRYLDLAKTNVSHFSNVPVGQRNIDVWRKMHSEAIQNARLSTGNATLINRAWAENAAADHYLTDAFSAGHLRQQRDKLIKEDNQFESLKLHTLDNKFGVLVTNKRGDKAWIAYGDDFLGTKGRPEHYLKVKEAVELSKKDIQDALNAGKTYSPPTSFPAEELVPVPASSANRWTSEDVRAEMTSLAVKEAPDLAGEYFVDSAMVLKWIRKVGLEALKRQSALEKLRMIDTLMSGLYLDEDECWGVRQICGSTVSDYDRQVIQVDYDLSPCFKNVYKPEWIAVGSMGRTKNAAK